MLDTLILLTVLRVPLIFLHFMRKWTQRGHPARRTQGQGSDTAIKTPAILS